MACNVINSWTFTCLVGAFLDLSIAYLLLCGSTLAYLASKFLGLFGQSLPCPCNGLFGNPHNYNCFQAMLVNNPALKISYVQSSVKNKLPFDSIWNNFHREIDDEYHECHSNLENWQNGNVEMGGEGSSGSCKSKKDFIGARKGSFEPVLKRKGLGNRRPRAGLKHRKRVTNGYGGKVLSFSYDPLASIATLTGLNASATVGEIGNDITEDGREISKEIRLPKRGSPGFEVDDDPFTENKPIENELPLAEFECLTPPDPNFDGSDRNAIRVLEQAVDEENAACTALYLELEKERIAAATAADEAMSMILRLQEEKAAIEMEARQYQRMMEEKFAYDAEEMNILKEILIRREEEKHFLEKEVEAYKQIFFENEPLDTDMCDMVATEEQRTSNEEQLLMLKRIAESVGEKEKTKNNGNFSEYEVTSVRSPNHPLDLGKELAVSELNDAASLNSSIKKNHAHRSRSDYQSTTPWGSDLHEKAINPMVEEEQCSETGPHQSLTPNTTEAKIIFPYNNKKMEKHRGDLHSLDSGIDCHLFDVHVINDESNLNKEETENRSEKKSICVTSNFPRTCGKLTTGGLEIEPGRKRYSLDRFGGLPPISPSRVKSLPPISRRNSMSAFDYERLKIDNEVGWLRERLKVVQQGRDKLNFPAGHKEREQVQLQILENIASQLRDIRQLTERGKAFRQASLPHPPSKVMSKKRYQRGARLDVLRSI